MNKYAGKNIDQILEAIMTEYQFNSAITISEEAKKRIKQALSEAFSIGWQRGENFAK